MREVVTHLERHGYLTREPDPSDEWARLLRLTPAGRRLEQDVVAASSRLHLSWQHQLGEDLFGSLWTALQTVTGQDAPLPDAVALEQRASRPTGGVRD